MTAWASHSLSQSPTYLLSESLNDVPNYGLAGLTKRLNAWMIKLTYGLVWQTTNRRTIRFIPDWLTKRLDDHLSNWSDLPTGQDQLANWLIHARADSLTNKPSDRPMDWRISGRTEEPADWPTDWPTDYLVHFLSAFLPASLINQWQFGGELALSTDRWNWPFLWLKHRLSFYFFMLHLSFGSTIFFHSFLTNRILNPILLCNFDFFRLCVL